LSAPPEEPKSWTRREAGCDGGCDGGVERRLGLPTESRLRRWVSGDGGGGASVNGRP